MDIETAAKALKELGHPIRLSIYKQIIRSGCQGLAVGSLQKKLAIPGSTLSHHITSLMSAQLVSQRREGRTLFCVAEFETLQAVMTFLQNECCIDSTVGDTCQ